MLKLRQFYDRMRHRLLFVPLVFIAVAIGLTQVTLGVDRELDASSLPEVLRTTVDSARAILSSIAGGLISSVTLLLSLMLVAVQLASSQFSPRTVRNWIGDRTLQYAIGVVMGTVVYCLLILRETRTFGEAEDQLTLTPHVSVIVAVVLGIVSLGFVIRSVDHLTDRLRIGSVASGIMNDTIMMIERNERLSAAENPGMVPAGRPTETELERDPPPDAMPIPAPRAGWVQQIETAGVIKAVPEQSTVYVTTSVGSFTFPNAPLAWVWPRPEDEEACVESVCGSIAIGESRTLQEDIGFGILQMVDIALRALSPGVNDPNTANDLIVHLGVVMLALWERPVAATVEKDEGRTLIRHDLQHSDYLHATFDPLRTYGAADPLVAATMVRTLATLRAETVRRELPGPLEPIDEVVAQIIAAVEASNLSSYDRASVTSLAVDGKAV